MSHVQRFCVIAQARTGSEALTTRLNEHPEIACHRELFNRKTVYSALKGAAKLQLPSVEERDADPVAALERVVALSSQAFPAKPVFGFKLFLNHAQAVRKVVRTDPRWRLVVLERRNKLAQFVSMHTARETGTWSVFSGKAGERAAALAANPVTVDVDVAELERFVELETQRYREYRQRLAGRADVLSIETEEIDARFAEVLDFLGVTVTDELRVVRGRQNPAPLRTRIRNWDEVEAWLRRTDHGTWAGADSAARAAPATAG